MRQEYWYQQPIAFFTNLLFCIFSIRLLLFYPPVLNSPLRSIQNFQVFYQVFLVIMLFLPFQTKIFALILKHLVLVILLIVFLIHLIWIKLCLAYSVFLCML